MGSYFSKTDMALLKGKYASLARKYKVSTSYVKLLVLGKRKTNTKLSRHILKDTESIVELFRPLSVQELMEVKEDE